MPKDPKTFREMSEPFPNVEEANKALTGFFEELGPLRKKYKIANVHVIVAVNLTIEGEEGGEGEIVTNGHYGDSLKAEPMTAWALGYEQAKREESIAKMIRDGVRRGKKEK